MLIVDGVSYVLAGYEVGGVGCPAPPTTITVAGTGSAAPGPAGQAGQAGDHLPSQALLGLLKQKSFSGSLTLFDLDQSPLQKFAFTSAHVTSFAETNGVIQLTITAESITAGK